MLRNYHHPGKRFFQNNLCKKYRLFGQLYTLLVRKLWLLVISTRSPQLSKKPGLFQSSSAGRSLSLLPQA
jgi:hypothetical protein